MKHQSIIITAIWLAVSASPAAGQSFEAKELAASHVVTCGPNKVSLLFFSLTPITVRVSGAAPGGPAAAGVPLDVSSPGALRLDPAEVNRVEGDLTPLVQVDGAGVLAAMRKILVTETTVVVAYRSPKDNSHSAVSLPWSLLLLKTGSSTCRALPDLAAELLFGDQPTRPAVMSALRKHLASAGHGAARDGGPPDAVPVEGLRSFQKAKALAASGTLDAPTIKALVLDLLR